MVSQMLSQDQTLCSIGLKIHRRVSPVSIAVDVRYVAQAHNDECVWRDQRWNPDSAFFPLLLLNISNAAISRRWKEDRPSSIVQDPELWLERWLTAQSCLPQCAQAAPSRSITALATALAWHFYKYWWREMDTSPMLTISMMNCFLAAFFFTFFILYFLFALNSQCSWDPACVCRKRWWTNRESV